jgi:hypothetical protein
MTVTTVSSCLGVVPWGGALGWCLGVVPWGGALGWCLAPLYGTFVPFAPLSIGLLFISLLLHVYTIICIYIFSFCKINKAVKSKRQRGNSFATIRGGGVKVPFRGIVFVFLKLPPAACTIPWVGNYVSRQLQPYGNTHKNHSRQTLHDTFAALALPCNLEVTRCEKVELVPTCCGELFR